MTAPALWTRHRPIAHGIARDYRVKGYDQDDLDQEALIALWEAAMSHNPERGPFTAFARLVIHRRLINLLRASTTQGRSGEQLTLTDVAAPEPPLDELRAIINALPSLSPLERRSLAAAVNGDPQDKRTTNAAERARRKLREAA